MFQKREKCGRCKQVVDFTFSHVAEYEIREPLPRRNAGLSVLNVRVIGEDDKVKAYGVATCPLCGGPSLMLFITQRRWLQSIRDVLSTGDWLNGGGDLIRIEELLPTAPEPPIDPHWPTQIHDLFRDAQALLSEGRSPSLAIGSCRSVIDVSVKELNAEGHDLKAKIDDLRSKGVITAGIAEWAHRTRLAGNDALHEIKGTAAEAKELVDFTRMFLDVAFSLPESIKARQKS